MSDFNYGAEAELFPGASRKRVAYRRFSKASEAIRFAMEELQPKILVGAYLEVNEARFDHTGIRRLYDSDRYPLKRAVRTEG
jgi:hypothetical protein